MMGWDTAIYFLIASVVISLALMPKIAPTPPAAFEDFDFPQADEGTPQAVIFGDVHLPDWTVATVGNYRSEAIRSEGGKK